MPKFEIEHYISQEQLEKVKAHFVKHRTKYWIGSLVVVAGITYIVLKRRPSLLGLNSPTEVTVSASIVGDHNLLDQRVITLIDRKGPPSYVIGKWGSDEEWISMGRAAREEGLRLSDLRAHLNGEIETLNDEKYFRKGLAAASKSQEKLAA